MAERKYDRLNALIYPYLGLYAPWEDKIGAPGFPKKYLWEPSGFEPETVACQWNVQTGNLTVTGTSGTESADIVITIISPTECKIEYKKKGTIEGIITEKVLDNPKRVIVTVHSDQDPKADVIITVQQQDNNAFISLKFNGKDFSGSYTFGQETIPPYLLALGDEIAAYNPNIKVAGVNHMMAALITAVAYDIAGKSFASGGPKWWELAASVVAAYATDYLTDGAGTVGTGAANLYMMFLPRV